MITHISFRRLDNIGLTSLEIIYFITYIQAMDILGKFGPFLSIKANEEMAESINLYTGFHLTCLSAGSPLGVTGRVVMQNNVCITICRLT